VSLRSYRTKGAIDDAPVLHVRRQQAQGDLANLRPGDLLGGRRTWHPAKSAGDSSRLERNRRTLPIGSSRVVRPASTSRFPKTQHVGRCAGYDAKAHVG